MPTTSKFLLAFRLRQPARAGARPSIRPGPSPPAESSMLPARTTLCRRDLWSCWSNIAKPRSEGRSSEASRESPQSNLKRETQGESEPGAQPGVQQEAEELPGDRSWGITGQTVFRATVRFARYLGQRGASRT